MTTPAEGAPNNLEVVITALVRELAREQAPRLFAIVEEYGQAQDARVAGYGLAYPERAEVSSVTGGFHLKSENPERARRLFEISSGIDSARRMHLVWLDQANSTEQN